jgi:hypothetical protein
MVREGFLVVFDLRDPEAVRRFHDEHAPGRERAAVEMLDEDQAVLLVRSGSSTREEQRAA